MTLEQLLLIAMVCILIVGFFLQAQSIRSILKTSKQDIDETQRTLELLNRDNMDRFIDRIDNRFNELSKRNHDFERQTTEALERVRMDTTRSLSEQFMMINTALEKRLNSLDTKVNESLTQGFEKTNEAFNNMIKSLSKIDEAQKNIDALSTEIVSLQDVLTDKKARGAFGEVQLNQILTTVFGASNTSLYQLQYSFGTGSRADAVLFAPEPLGTIAIDSKFPLENYRLLVDTTRSEEARLASEKAFSADIKKHIDDIATRYIIPGETSDQAFMFIPAEAIFAYINAYLPDVLDYAYKRHIWIASPTTLMSTLTTIQAIVIHQKRSQYTEIIHDQLNRLQVEFERYSQRWEKLKRTMNTMQRDVDEITITTDKITKSFDRISAVDLPDMIEQSDL